MILHGNTGDGDYSVSCLVVIDTALAKTVAQRRAAFEQASSISSGLANVAFNDHHITWSDPDSDAREVRNSLLNQLTDEEYSDLSRIDTEGIMLIEPLDREFRSFYQMTSVHTLMHLGEEGVWWTTFSHWNYELFTTGIVPYDVFERILSD